LNYYYDIKQLTEDSPVSSLDTDFMDKNKQFYNINLPGIFSEKECQNILEYTSTVSLSPGLNRANKKVDYRNSDVYFLDKNSDVSWIYHKAAEVLHIINQYYQFDITHMSRPQYAEYAVGQFLDWHTDDCFKFLGESNDYIMRKISVSIFLTEPEDYEGGQFELMLPNTENKEAAQIMSFNLPKGHGLAFPSFLPHRVMTITKNIRRSLVFWYYGKAWR
jgi:PKHD-type hydroxylase